MLFSRRIRVVCAVLGALATGLFSVTPASAATSYVITDLSPQVASSPLGDFTGNVIVKVTNADGSIPLGIAAQLYEGSTDLHEQSGIDGVGYIQFGPSVGVGTHTFYVHVGDQVSAPIVRTYTRGDVYGGYPAVQNTGTTERFHLQSVYGSRLTPTGTFSLLQDRTTTLATFPISTTAYDIPIAQYNGHIVQVVYNGDINYLPKVFGTFSDDVRVPVAMTWTTTNPIYPNTWPSIIVDLDAGVWTDTLNSSVSFSVDGNFATTSSVVHENGHATATFGGVRFGTHTYTAKANATSVFLEATSPSLVTNLPKGNATLKMARAEVGMHLDTYAFTLQVDADANTPFGNQIDGDVSMTVDGKPSSVSVGSYSRMTCYHPAQHCSAVAYFNNSPMLSPGDHTFVFSMRSDAFNVTSASSTVYQPVPNDNIDTGVKPGANTNTNTTTSTSTGYRIVSRNGNVLAAGGAADYGHVTSKPNQSIVGSASTPSGKGYWLVASDGGIFAFGDATFFGSMGGQPLNKPIVGMAATPSGKGYWLVASDGGIFAFGDATFFGSMGGQPLNKPIVGMAATPSGHGYRFVASDGGIFSFGDAKFYGSMGGQSLNKPIVGMAATTSGYWLVASDGGIFSFGNAPFYGSTGSIKLNQPIVGMKATADNAGYWFVAADGGIFSYGTATFAGSGLSIATNGDSVVGML